MSVVTTTTTIIAAVMGTPSPRPLVTGFGIRILAKGVDPTPLYRFGTPERGHHC